MSNSHAIAQIIGIFTIFFGLGMASNKDHMKQAVQDFTASHALQLVAAMIPLLLGSILVIIHGEWTRDWRSAITLFGWLMLLGGIYRNLCPKHWITLARKMDQTILYPVLGWGFLIVGLVLFAFGRGLILGGLTGL